MKRTKTKTSARCEPTNTTRLEEMVVTLQRAIDKLDEVSSFFEALGMGCQTKDLDSALERIMDVQELVEVLLGRVELA